MTDEASEQEEPQRAAVRYRGADGEWHELPVSPRDTGDPELDAIWRLSFKELREIIDDESHPLYAKARQVSTEMVRPVIDAANEIMRPLTESLAKSINTSRMIEELDLARLVPAIDTASWAAKLVPQMPKFELPKSLLDSLSAMRQVEPLPELSLSAVPVIDFDAIEPPDASLFEIQEAAEARAHEMRNRQIEILTALLVETRAGAESGKEALTVSKEALNETRSSKRAGWTAAWAAVAAGVIGVAGILVTLLVAR